MSGWNSSRWRSRAPSPGSSRVAARTGSELEIVANQGLCLMRQILWTMTPAAAEFRWDDGTETSNSLDKLNKVCLRWPAISAPRCATVSDAARRNAEEKDDSRWYAVIVEG